MDEKQASWIPQCDDDNNSEAKQFVSFVVKFDHIGAHGHLLGKPNLWYMLCKNLQIKPGPEV